MDPAVNEQDINAQIAERFHALPKVVQDAIRSADVQQHMRALADQHQLHFDQWSVLENEVMFALLGFEPVENLAGNLEHEVGVSHEIAIALADDISRTVFAPIRTELEHALQAQAAPATAETASSNTSNETMAAAEHPLAQIVPAIAPVVPGTPPPPPPEGKARRAPVSESYGAGQPSVERKIVEGDPYRESVA